MDTERRRKIDYRLLIIYGAGRGLEEGGTTGAGMLFAALGHLPKPCRIIDNL